MRAESAQPLQSYSRSAVRRILKLNENRLRSWERHGLVTAREEFGFSDLRALRTLQLLRGESIPAQRIKDALDSLGARLTEVEQPLLECKLVAHGRQVAVELPGIRMDALSGQLLLQFEAGQSRRIWELEGSGGVSADHVQRAEEWFRRALELETLDDRCEEALSAYERAIELNPRAAGAWVNVGTLYYRRRELDNAETCYRQALDISPNYALAHFNLGNICEESDRLEEAANHYRLALRLQSGYADAHYNLALVYERLSEPMRAARHWRAYLQLDSVSPWASIARQQLQRLLPVMPGGRTKNPA